MLLNLKIRFMLCVLYLKSIFCQKLVGYVVGGITAEIVSYPHSAYVAITCNPAYEEMMWVCGSSILNQRVLITAAHCLMDCEYFEPRIMVTVGHSNIENGTSYEVEKFFIHNDFDRIYLFNDICLLGLKKSIKFSNKVARIAIYKSPPSSVSADIAGWGVVQEELEISSQTLNMVSQKIIDTNECMESIPELPKGTICAGSLFGTGYPSIGDSGSALVVNKYIQIGIVSFKIKEIARSLSVYTEIAYHYDWIKENSMKLFCEVRKSRSKMLEMLGKSP